MTIGVIYDHAYVPIYSSLVSVFKPILLINQNDA